jgi:putative thiamine transport system permease protein
LLPAFGYLPAVGGRSLGLAPSHELVFYPGFASAGRLTLTTGFVATAAALALAAGFCATVHGRVRFRAAETMLTPLLAAPHSAVAIGLAFVLAPSG